MAEVIEAPKAQTKRAVYAMPEYMQLAEQWRQDFVLHVPEEHTVEDLQDTAYWAHVAAQRAMQRFDRIEARAETGEWVADLLVVNGETFRVIKSEDWSANGYSHVFAEGFLPPAVPS